MMKDYFPRKLLLLFMPLAGLWSFGCLHPLFAALSTDTVTLVTWRLGGPDLIALVIALTLSVPLLLSVASYLLNPDIPNEHNPILGISILFLSTVTISCQFIRLFGPDSYWPLPLGLVVGWLIAKAYARFLPVRRLLSALSISVVAVPVLFLWHPEVQALFSNARELQAYHRNPERLTPFVMLVFDELPLVSLVNQKLEIDANLFPNFAALASESHWFRNATTVTGHTSQALPAILTGKYPKDPDQVLPIFSTHPLNLFTLLSPPYALEVFEQFSQMCPESVCAERVSTNAFFAKWKIYTQNVFGVALKQWIPHSYHELFPKPLVFATGNYGTDDLSKFGGRDDETLFERFLTSLGTSKEGTLNFIHVTLPHFPFCRYPSGKFYAPENWCRTAELPLEAPKDEEAARLLYQQHLLQAGYTDALVGRLLAHMKVQGIYDKCMLIVMADHGTAFLPGSGGRAIRPGNLSGITRIPLFIKLPHQAEGRVSDENVESVDILPTMLGALGSEKLAGMDGQDVFSPAFSARPVKLFYKWDEQPAEFMQFPAKLEFGDSVIRKGSLFGVGERGLFADPENAWLIGQPIETVTGPDVRAEVDSEQLYDKVNLGGRSIPGFIKGRLHPPALPKNATHLVVALNGRIAAVTKMAGPPETKSEFAVMVPEAAFQSEKNTIRLRYLALPH